MAEKTVDVDITQKVPYDHIDINIDTNPRTRCGTSLYGYWKRTYTPTEGYTIGTVTNAGKPQIIEASFSINQALSVFYWAARETTLLHLLQLGTGDEYYYTNGDTKWIKHPNTSSDNLLYELDGWNCLLNSIHVADISHSTTYYCPSCGSYSHRSIGLMLYDTQKSSHHYVRYDHNIGGKVGNIRNKDNTILSVPDGVSNLYVYWSTGANATPRLLYYSVGNSDRWFSIYHGDTVWSEESALTQDPQTEDPTEIQKIVQGFSTPNVVIDLQKEQTDSYNSKNSTLDFKAVKSNVSSSGYYEYNHSMVSGDAFKVKRVIHGQRTLDDIKPYSTAGVSAYYFGENPVYENLLLIQLGNDKYYTWKSDNNWTSTSGITNVTETLKKEVCNRRKYHILDISKKVAYSSLGCSQIIQVESTGEVVGYEHTKHGHGTTNKTHFSVSYFVNNDTPQTNLPSANNVSKVWVFWYPKNHNPKPLLIFYDKEITADHEEKWFKKVREDNWEEVIGDGKPSYEGESRKIEDLLKEISGDLEGAATFVNDSNTTEHNSENSNEHSTFETHTNSSSGPSGGAIAGYTATGGLATAEIVNFTLDTGWSLIRRALTIFNAAL